MDRLEAVEIKLSHCLKIIDFRIDANTYKKDYIRTEKVLLCNNLSKISDAMKTIQNFGAYSLCNNINFVDSGIPFLMTQNIRHNYIDWNYLRYIDEKSHAILHKSHCKRNQVLVTMAGEYLGRVAVYDKDFTCSSNQAIAKITFKKQYHPYLISTFLNTRYGQNQINRFKTITGQPNINMALISSLLFPVFSENFADSIEKVYLLSNNLKEKCSQLYREAQNLLLLELGLLNYMPTKEAVAIKTFSESFNVSGRFDAEYYQPKYDDIISKLKEISHNTLGNLLTIKKSIEPGSECYGDEGIPFVRVSNLSKFELSNPEIRIPRNIVSNVKSLYPKKDTILLSKDGSVGIAYKVTDDLSCITSGAILHLKIINKDELLPDYITLVLNSLVVQLQAERDAGGSIIQHWKPSEIEQVIIPILGLDLQKQISDKVQESFKLRKKSNLLLEQAKQAVEIAIEQGEAVAIKWLEENKID